ncbi:TetR/AcrR family transcriptional regulator [Flindersiella endophytica]
MGVEEKPDTRQRIVDATSRLLADGGRDAVTTRAVSAAAGVQPPTIYRLFGDMRGLLDAVAAHGFSTYLEKKIARPPAGDPVDDLREGWDQHVEFGVSNPELYSLMYGQTHPDQQFEAAAKAAELLRGLVERIAAAGRLRLGVEEAAQLLHATGLGVVLTLIATPPGQRDPELSQRTREAILSAITLDPQRGRSSARKPSAASHAVALKAALPNLGDVLSEAERGLLAEWLDRIGRSRA